MAELFLLIGNKKYSSWSLRPWLALKHCGIDFEEQLVALDRPDTAEKIRAFSPSGRVPFLRHGAVDVWESLAMLEYLAEAFPAAKLWPEDRAARAHARSIAAEMHSGFLPFRKECSMNLHRPVGAITLSEDARADIARIQEIWTDCRARHGKRGPFLFGAFGAADAMFAPVVHRFRSYAIAVSLEVKTYMQTLMEFPAFKEWTEAGLAETLLIAKFENV